MKRKAPLLTDTLGTRVHAHRGPTPRKRKELRVRCKGPREMNQGENRSLLIIVIMVYKE